MRIIGGEFRGRQIQAPPGMGTRPMASRVREAMFSTLAPWLKDGRVLDLFAGSGCLGLEALSRGAAEVRFVDRDPKVAALIRENVAELGLGERAEVRAGDALAAHSWNGEGWADIIILDPPYPMLDDPELRPQVFRALQALIADVLAPEGVLIFHVPRRKVDRVHFGEQLQVADREYGSHALWYLQAEEA